MQNSIEILQTHCKSLIFPVLKSDTNEDIWAQFKFLPNQEMLVWLDCMQRSKVSRCLTVFKVYLNFCVWKSFPGQTVLLESLPTSFREGNKFYSNILSRLAELLQYSSKIRNIKRTFRTSQFIREVHIRQWRLEMRLFVSSPEIVQNYCFQHGD